MVFFGSTLIVLPATPAGATLADTCYGNTLGATAFTPCLGIKGSGTYVEYMDVGLRLYSQMHGNPVTAHVQLCEFPAGWSITPVNCISLGASPDHNVYYEQDPSRVDWYNYPGKYWVTGPPSVPFMYFRYNFPNNSRVCTRVWEKTKTGYVAGGYGCGTIHS